MLESITISNFKAIKDEPSPNVVAGLNPPDEKIFEQRDGIWYKKKPLILNNLTNVNYLVGENGSGKSSVLEGLFGRSKVEEKVKLTLKLSDSQIDSFQTDKTRFTENQINQLKKIKTSVPSYKETEVFLHSKNISETLDSILPEYKNRTDIYNGISNFLSYSSARFKMLTSNEVQFNELSGSYDKSVISNNKEYILNFKFNPSYIENHKLLIDFLNKYFFKGNEVFNINRDSNKDLLRVVTTKYDIVELNSLAGGYQFLFGLYNSITKAINYNELNTVVLIEEPEIALHPKMQKLIPDIVRSFSEKGVQFLISTHSPFIISEAGKIAEDEFEKAKNDDSDLKRENFKPSQKVYQIKGGKCEVENGVWGFESIGTSAEMLGAGLDSVISPAKQPVNITNYIIYCEGNKKGDYKIYNQIFKPLREEKTPIEFLFISCASCDEVVTQYKMAKTFYKLQKGQLEIKGLVDKDPDKKDEHLIWKSDGVNILGRRELENYLFEYEIAKSLLKTETNEEEYYQKLGTTKSEFFEFDVKGVLCEGGQKLRSELFKNSSLDKIKTDLAKLITPQTTTYQELHNCIFGSSVKPDK